MSMPPWELQGTWEEILTHSDELAGKRVQVTVVTPPKPTQEEIAETMALMSDLRNNPWTPEELKFFDDFEQFRKEHPFSLRKPEDLD